MARKKQEIALQAEIETQEEWEEMLAKEGVTVVDIYQDWTGPCKAMISNFRRLKNELGDDLLRFAVAKADTVDALEAYRGKCQPCFTLFAGGVLVAVVRGCNAPSLLKTITEQLSHEHKVLEGKAERKEVRDPMLAAKAAKEKQEEEEDEEEEEEDEEQGEERLKSPTAHTLKSKHHLSPKTDKEQKKDVTVAIIKPDVVADGKVDSVLEKLKEAGIEVLEHIERTLTEEEARDFYAHRKEEEYYEGLVQFMTSGPSHLLVITKGDTGEGIIEEWRELLGPASVEEAKEQAPDSLRAQFGKESYVNALHGSDSKDTAMKELAFFFPDFVVPIIPGAKTTGKKAKIERTLALVKPEELAEKKDEILGKIKEAGFTIAMVKEIQLTKEQAEEFYSEHREQDYFEGLTTTMSTGPVMALALAREDAVSAWKKLTNPEGEEEDSLMRQYSNQGVTLTLHGSETQEAAKKELDYIFPVQKTVAVIKPDGYQTKDEIMSKIKEAGFHIAARKETDLSRDVAEQFYKDLSDKEFYGDLVDHMTSGPTLFMVLSREDAVDGWRSLIGPTDPEKAKEEAPNSLRALYGKDIKQNAVHGSSNPQHAEKHIELVFSDAELTQQQEGEAQQEEQQQASRETTQAEEGEGDQGEKTQEAAQPETQQEGETQQETQPETQETQEEQKEAGEGEKTEEQTGEQEVAATTGEQEAAAEGEPEQQQQQQAEGEKTGDEAAGSEKTGDEAGSGEQQEPAAATEQEQSETPAESSEQQQQDDKPAEPEQSQEEKPSEETPAQQEAEPEQTQETQPEQQAAEEQQPAAEEEKQPEPAQQSEEQQPAEQQESSEQKQDESSEEAKPAETSEEQTAAETTEEQKDEEQKED